MSDDDVETRAAAIEPVAGDPWPARLAAVLGGPPAWIVAGRSEGDVPRRGPVMIATGRSRLVVLPGSREEPPGDAPGAVVDLADLLQPPELRPARRRHAPLVELRTANAQLRLAAPLASLHAIVDAFTAATGSPPGTVELAFEAPAAPSVAPVLAPPAARRRPPAGYALRDGVLVPLRRPPSEEELHDVVR